MMQDLFQYTIRASLPQHTEGPALLGARFLDTLDALSRIDPAIFDDWQIMDLPAVESFALEEARPRIAAIIGNNVKRDDDDEPDPHRGYTACVHGRGRRTAHNGLRYHRGRH